jgi:hypothetical protein
MILDDPIKLAACAYLLSVILSSISLESSENRAHIANPTKVNKVSHINNATIKCNPTIQLFSAHGIHGIINERANKGPEYMMLSLLVFVIARVVLS